MYSKTKYKSEVTATLLLVAVFLTGCNSSSSNSTTTPEPVSTPVPETTPPTINLSGSADFSTYIAFGDSLTAGYADSALYSSGQENSFPNILAKQFALAGGGSFNQPLVKDDIGGLLIGGLAITDTRLKLLSTASDASSSVAGTPSTDVLSPVTGSFNNMGVPAAKSFHTLAMGYGYRDAATLTAGGANPFYAYFASEPSSSATMIDDAAAQLPSFFTLWIGANDVLAYATSGGTGVDQLGNIDSSTYSASDITDPALFATTYNVLVSRLLASGSKGVLINIPDVSSIPYFTTVAYNALPLTISQASDSNTAYATYNAAIASSALSSAEKTQRTINFTSGQNPLVIEDDNLTDLTAGSLPSIRQATADDYIVLTAAAKIGIEETTGDPTTIWGLGKALLDADVLTLTEATLVANAQTAYNSTIAAAATANADLLIYDAKTSMAQMKNSGINYGSGTITAVYNSGGGFSLDGVHPTARGYAVIANQIIDLINQSFSANIPTVDPGTYTTVFYH